MKLINANVKKFRNYVDSEELNVENTITSIIGKNESGKTTFLKALYSLNPDNPNELNIDVDIDYPRWFKVRDARKLEKEGSTLGDARFIEAYFSLNGAEIDYLTQVLGIPVPTDAKLSLEKDYNGKLSIGLWSSEEDWISSLIKSDIVKKEEKSLIKDFKTLEGIIDKFTSLKNEKTEELDKIEELNIQNDDSSDDVNDESEENIPEEEISNPELDEINREIDYLNEVILVLENIKKSIDEYISDTHIDALKKIIPTFFYFGSYNTLEGRIDLKELIDKDKSQIDKQDQTALALLKLIGVNGEELMDTNYEIRKAELESAASEVTRQVLNYWTQNKDIYVELDIDSKKINAPNGKDVVHRFLDVRLRDQRHQMTTNFSTRSTGFQWFFSFLVAFSDFTDQNNVIILLDEPGLGLHGSAQNDLLNFIEKELGDGRQVIYTSHSPFMVNPKRLERVRLVEDNTSDDNPDLGAKILDEVLNVKMPETLFPLQAALGYDIAQNLFIGQYTLLVEGPSELIIFELLSEFLKEKNMISLNDKIIITPVGGADKIPTFVALLGTHIDVTVLVDANMRNNQKLQDLINLDILKEKRLISIGQVTSNKESANVEDLFSDEEYLSLYNEAFKSKIKPEDIIGDESIVNRIEKFKGGSYNHFGPLKVLQRDLSFLDKLSDETLQRFENLFDVLNKTFND